MDTVFHYDRLIDVVFLNVKLPALLILWCFRQLSVQIFVQKVVYYKNYLLLFD